MKTQRIGEVNFGRMKTEFCATPNVIALLKKWKISNSFLLPPGWAWYDSELLERIDEDGDGKPDERFGKDFKVIYFMKEEKDIHQELEKEGLLFSSTRIKNIEVKYAAIKCQK